MEETEDFSRKESKTVTSGKLGRIVPIPVKTTDASEEVPPSMNEKKMIDAVKRRLAPALSRELQEE